jgi:hypothetical protein
MKWTKVYVSAKHLGQQIVETACEFFEVKELKHANTIQKKPEVMHAVSNPDATNLAAIACGLPRPRRAYET